jgi:hypothetical protein
MHSRPASLDAAFQCVPAAALPCAGRRIEALQAAKPAIQALYQALTPEQRAIFDPFRR